MEEGEGGRTWCSREASSSGRPRRLKYSVKGRAGSAPASANPQPRQQLTPNKVLHHMVDARILRVCDPRQLRGLEGEGEERTEAVVNVEPNHCTAVVSTGRERGAVGGCYLRWEGRGVSWDQSKRWVVAYLTWEEDRTSRGELRRRQEPLRPLLASVSPSQHCALKSASALRHQAVLLRRGTSLLPLGRRAPAPRVTSRATPTRSQFLRFDGGSCMPRDSLASLRLFKRIFQVGRDCHETPQEIGPAQTPPRSCLEEHSFDAARTFSSLVSVSLSRSWHLSRNASATAFAPHHHRQDPTKRARTLLRAGRLLVLYASARGSTLRARTVSVCRILYPGRSLKLTFLRRQGTQGAIPSQGCQSPSRLRLTAPPQQCNRTSPCAPCTMRDLTCHWIRGVPAFVLPINSSPSS